MKIGIDGRRNFGSGIGRVTSNVIEGLINYDTDNEYILFISKPRDWNGQNVKIERCDIQFFSEDDLFELPKLISKAGIDVFVSPQFYISPFIECPTVKFVHDLWPLLYREWVPSYKDFLSHFGQQSGDGIVTFLKLFQITYERGTLFPDNRFLKGIVSDSKLKKTEKYVAAMMACTLHTAEIVIVPSNHTINEIATTFPEVISKVRMVPNFPSPIFLCRSNVARRPYILHVAKWEPRKNLEQVLKVGQFVYSRFKMKLLLVGDQGYRGYGRDIKKTISKAPYNLFVEHLGVVKDEVLAELYRTAQIFLFPSLYEGFGIPPLEAMACGTPVVAGKAGALPEICGGAAVLVNPDDTKEIQTAIAQLLTDKDHYSTMVHKGLLRSQSFDRTESIRLLNSVIKEVAGNKRANQALEMDWAKPCRF